MIKRKRQIFVPDGLIKFNSKQKMKKIEKNFF